MKIIFMILASFLIINVSSATEEKCTWNILKSNCKTKNFSKMLGSKLNKGVEIIKPAKNILKNKNKK
jgi:hypothetical protein|tara:strand:+ start:76 stop:276 length:201 start_codon:yes stop_codon:yes gene_type:complete